MLEKINKPNGQLLVSTEDIDRLIKAMSKAIEDRFEELELKPNEPKQNEYLPILRNTEIYRKCNGVLQLPTESTILIGDYRTGKSTLMKFWHTSIKNKSRELFELQAKYIREEKPLSSIREIRAELLKHTSKFITELELRTRIEDGDYFDDLSGYRYVFIDDLLYPSNWSETTKSSNGMKVRTGFKAIWDFLADNQDKIIVIGSTNIDIGTNSFDEPINHRIREVFKVKVMV